MPEIQNTLSTDEKIDLLTRDFLERDENDRFVRIRRTGRLGWESTLPEGSAYSEYFLHPRNNEDLIRNAYGLATDMITVMDAPFKVNIAITPDNSSTDAQTVWVATRVFDDPDLSTGKKLDTFVGLAVHEGCHLLYTKFEEGRKCSNKIVHSLQNIIEDERIERECGESKPGLANFLKASKYYYFDKYREDMQKTGQMNGLDTFQRLMNTILAYVRYPKALETADLQEFADVMLKVREILLPYPASTAGSTAAAEKIYEVMKDFLQEQEQEQKQQQASGGSESSSGEEGQEGSPSGNTDGQSGNDGSETGKQMEKSFSGMQQALGNIVSEPRSGLDESDQSETVKEDGGKVGKVCQGALERGHAAGSYFEKAGEDRNTYLESLSRVSRYIGAVRKAVDCETTERKFVLRGQRSGRFDPTRIAEAYQGVPTVYMRQGEVTSDRINVCVLIDESGSMWGNGESAARDTAVLLNEALGGCTNLYIYGHTASKKTTDMFVYREPGSQKRFALGTTDSRAGNHDSVAIREAVSRVRRFTSEPVLFFMISDGAPNESTELVRKAVDDMERQGVKVIAISIDPYYDPSTMYRRNVNLGEDLSSLPINIGRLVRKLVLDSISTTTKIA